MFVVAVAAVKDAVEDYQRHKADAKANSEEVSVCRVCRFDSVHAVFSMKC